ncbi:MAG TPA: UDP-glucose/GDP-mannose dehydrogenase family protein [Candidatus Omnitrophica bacterium]|nr:UDP-glucose/GDP-mannose dehydrogenase family protein [Candidatus Omnitrophota bacterium]
MELNEKLNASVIGAGYVGLVTGVCLAELGHNILCMDTDSKKIEALNRGELPIYEPGLKELLLKNREENRISFSCSVKDALKHGTVIFIAVGTPSKDNGEADLSYVENVARDIAVNMDSYRLVVEKSTVPVQTGEKVRQTLQLYTKGNVDFDVASNPEFLREGSAIRDFMDPDRIVIGIDSPRARDLLFCLYSSLAAPIIVTDIKSAELIKHASNSFLALKISFINALSRICEKVGADVEKVAEGMGLDKRIGPEFLKAGIGYGGSCFPKDVDAFIHISEVLGYDFNLLKEVRKINEEQKLLAVKKIKDTLWVLKGKKIAVWGASFKPDTDDVRNAPAISIISDLLDEGASVTIFDPKALLKIKELFKGRVEYAQDKYQVLEGADCLMLATEWDDFKDVDFRKVKNLMRLPFVLDGRNFYKTMDLEALGFVYVPFGSSYLGKLASENKPDRAKG